MIASSWLPGALAGGVISLVVSLAFSFIQPRIRRWQLTRGLAVEIDPPHGPHARLRVANRGYWTVKDTIVYMALEFSADDVAPPPDRGAFITPELFVPMEDEQLCWSVRSPTPNPIRVDIFARERQPICPCLIEPDCILIPSEELGKEGKWRVSLHRREYHGQLKVVSADTDARYFSLVIDPDNRSQPLGVRPLQRRESRERV
jgi:hypothetical protein